MEIWSNLANELRVGLDLRAVMEGLDGVGDGPLADEFLRGLWSSLVEAAGPEARRVWGPDAPSTIDDEMDRPEASWVYNLAGRFVREDADRLFRLFRRMADAVDRDSTIPSRPDLLAIEVHGRDDADATDDMVNVKVALRPRRPAGDDTRSVVDRIRSGEVLLKSIYSGGVLRDQQAEYLPEGAADNPSADLLQDQHWAPFLNDVSHPDRARQALREDDGRQDAMRRTGQARGNKRRPDRSDVMGKTDPRTGSVSPPGHRQLDISRNTYLYTRKTATSLVPTSSRIRPYNESSYRPTTGLLFDLHRSNLKGGRYFFDTDARSFNEQWLTLDPSPADRDLHLRTVRSLDQLQRQRLDGQPSEHGAEAYNEILAGVQPDGIIGVFFSAADQGEARPDFALLQGIARTRLIAQRLGRRAPPLIELGIGRDAAEVSREDQLKLLTELEQNPDRLRPLARDRLTIPFRGADPQAVTNNIDRYREQITGLREWLENAN